MREKLAFRMTFARAAHACTKRDAQAYLEQFQSKTKNLKEHTRKTEPVMSGGKINKFFSKFKKSDKKGGEEDSFAHLLSENQKDPSGRRTL